MDISKLIVLIGKKDNKDLENKLQETELERIKL
jgi:hypothetical protein